MIDVSAQHRRTVVAGLADREVAVDSLARRKSDVPSPRRIEPLAMVSDVVAGSSTVAAFCVNVMSAVND